MAARRQHQQVLWHPFTLRYTVTSKMTFFKLLLLKVLKHFTARIERMLLLSFPWDNEKLNRVLFYYSSGPTSHECKVTLISGLGKNSSSSAHVHGIPAMFTENTHWELTMLWPVQEEDKKEDLAEVSIHIFRFPPMTSSEAQKRVALRVVDVSYSVGIKISNVDHETVWSQSQSLRREELALHGES